MTVREPSKATLRKYGLSLVEWREYLTDQGGTCYVCRRVPPSGILCVDHEHQPRWKKMPADRRKLAVRGLLCSYCNRRLLAKGITLERASRIVDYLTAYKARWASYAADRIGPSRRARPNQ